MRRQYKALRGSLSHEERARRDGAICQAALDLVSFRYADIVLLYAPMEQEIDVFPIAREALQKGKQIAFPRCDAQSKTMEYHFVTSLSELPYQHTAFVNQGPSCQYTTTLSILTAPFALFQDWYMIVKAIA